MIQIIKPGTKKITKCEKCGCQFSYEEEDIRSDNRVFEETWVMCPQCHIRVIITAARIPKDASKSVQRRVGLMTEELF